ncbi:hypothetical protein [Pararhizobium antarcticum]|uniref:hypothetical protein n=1 Tax=Pararhizobium antarcticum TaxID=1798805 RepID=UPI001FDAA6DE|nr:hypothetical protein [Pararhizobium antarcticum]
MGRTAQLAEAFTKRHVKPLGLSTDRVDQQRRGQDAFPAGLDGNTPVSATPRHSERLTQANCAVCAVGWARPS